MMFLELSCQEVAGWRGESRERKAEMLSQGASKNMEKSFFLPTNWTLVRRVWIVGSLLCTHTELCLPYTRLILGREKRYQRPTGTDGCWQSTRFSTYPKSLQCNPIPCCFSLDILCFLEPRLCSPARELMAVAVHASWLQHVVTITLPVESPFQTEPRRSSPTYTQQP